MRIFIWYVTWNVAASRLVAATYCKLFWKTYKIAGIESFQQSGLKISRDMRRQMPPDNRRLDDWGVKAFVSRRYIAMTSDMEPLRSSLMKTADAAEYWRDVGIVVREVCMMIARAAFCTASVTSLRCFFVNGVL